MPPSASKPRVVIDARMVGPEGHGIALYVSQLAEGLAARSLPFEPFYLVHPRCPSDHLLRRLPHKEVPLHFLEPAELVGLPGELRKLAPALYHSPSFASLLRYPCPHVQTVHDLNHLRFGSFVQKSYYRFLLLPSLRKARAVVSVSHTSAAEITAWLKQQGSPRPVEVAPNAIVPFPEGNDLAELRARKLESGAFFFALGNPKPHKNLALLERAYRAALAREPSLPPLVLSVAGPSEAKVKRTGPLPAPVVGALLRHARAVFSPSLYEGFGRPPAEAALAGTIPVASDVPVHREVLEGVSEAVLLDPGQESLWEETFLRFRAHPGRVSPASQEWVRRKWSVEALAEKMTQIYLVSGYFR